MGARDSSTSRVTSPLGAGPNYLGPCLLVSFLSPSPLNALDPTAPKSKPPEETRHAQTSRSGRARGQPLYPRSLRQPLPTPNPCRGRGRARSTTHAPPRTRSASALALLPAPERRGRGCGRPPRVRRPRRGSGASERPAGRGLLGARLGPGPLAHRFARAARQERKAASTLIAGFRAAGAALPPPPSAPPPGGPAPDPIPPALTSRLCRA